MVSDKNRAAYDPSIVGKEAIREQVARIRASHPFRTSKRCLSLLDYVTEQTLEGQFDRLKERSLGVEVFGREPGYDTSQDPIVRYTAGEVRKRLAQYYQEPGHDREIRIDLPPGSYVPEFQTAPEEPVRAPVQPSRFQWPVAALALLLAVAAVVIARPWPAKTVVDRFWEPVLSDPGPVLFSVGESKVFGLPEPQRNEAWKLAEEYSKLGRPLPPLSSPITSVIPLWGRQLGLNDSICVARLASYLHGRGKKFEIRGGTATSLPDLRNGPGVLIGAFTNDWTLRMTEDFRFTLDYDSERSIGAIKDRQRPQEPGWQVPDVWPDPKVWTDYGLVSRIRHPSTGRMIVTAVGVDCCASFAAGELLTSPEHLGEALKGAPGDWPEKNIQIVFSTPVVNGSPGPPKFVALHVW